MANNITINVSFTIYQDGKQARPTNVQRPQPNAQEPRTSAQRSPANTQRSPTNTQKPPTNNLKPRTNPQKPRTNDQRPPTNTQRSSTNTQRAQSNDQRSRTSTHRASTNARTPPANAETVLQFIPVFPDKIENKLSKLEGKLVNLPLEKSRVFYEKFRNFCGSPDEDVYTMKATFLSWLCFEISEIRDLDFLIAYLDANANQDLLFKEFEANKDRICC